MGEGIGLGLLMIGGALFVIGLLSGGSQTALGIFLLFIAICWLISSEANSHAAYKKRVDTLKHWCPGHPESWYRIQIERNQDGENIAFASRKKLAEKLKQKFPGQRDSWYWDATYLPEYQKYRFEDNDSNE